MATMSIHEYQFLTGRWEGPKGAAYNEVYEFCRNHGWCPGFDVNGRAIITKQGVRAIKAFQSDLNYKRIDVI